MPFIFPSYFVARFLSSISFFFGVESNFFNVGILWIVRFLSVGARHRHMGLLNRLPGRWINAGTNKKMTIVVVLIDKAHVLGHEYKHWVLAWVEVLITHGGRFDTSVDQEGSKDEVGPIEAVHHDFLKQKEEHTEEDSHDDSPEKRNVLQVIRCTEHLEDDVKEE